jgi:hypothetical protein
MPEPKQKGWAKTPIDRFILSKLEAKGLKPAPAANKLTLLRRVTFDLTGLPPTLEELTAFERDESPDAFAKVVDRLLHLRSMASVGAVIGWTSRGTPTRLAWTKTISIHTPGVIATMSFVRSMRIRLITSSSSSSLRVIFCRRRAQRSGFGISSLRDSSRSARSHSRNKTVFR